MSGRLFRFQPGPPPGPLFDVHVHVGRSDAEEAIYGRLDGESLLRLCDEAGIARVCAFPPLQRTYGAANRELADWAAGTGGRVLPFARLGGRRGPAPVRRPWQLRRRLRALLVPEDDDVDPETLDRHAGVKMLPHLDGVPGRPTLERVAELELPAVIHAGVDCPPSWIARVLLPRLRGPVILAHLGAFPCDARLVEEAVELALAVDRVYLDTSAVWLASFLAHAAVRVPEKLLFGSDCPLMHPGIAWQHLAAAVLDDRRLEQIGFRNAEALFPAAERAGPGREG